MRNNETFFLSFWGNTSRVKNNQVTVFARITVNGKRVRSKMRQLFNLIAFDKESVDKRK